MLFTFFCKKVRMLEEQKVDLTITYLDQYSLCCYSQYKNQVITDVNPNISQNGQSKISCECCKTKRSFLTFTL